MANRTMCRIAKEMKKSRWVQLFKPKSAYQEMWASLGNELMQPINSVSIEQLADSTVLLLRAMGYKCEMISTKLMLGNFKVLLVGSEIMKWKRNLKVAFGVQGGTKFLVPTNRRAQVDMVLDEEKTPASNLDDQVERDVDDLVPVNMPLPPTAEAKRRVFSRIEEKPYQFDSHMVTPP